MKGHIDDFQKQSTLVLAVVSRFSNPISSPSTHGSSMALLTAVIPCLQLQSEGLENVRILTVVRPESIPLFVFIEDTLTLENSEHV